MILPGVIASSGGVASSFESIATTTVGSGGSASITFSSIPSTFTHLQIRGIVKMTNASTYPQLRFNGDTATNYSMHILYSSVPTASAYAATGGTYFDWVVGAGSTAQFSPFVTDILDFANTNKYKTVRSLNGVDENGAGGVQFCSGLWRSTSAITSLTIFASANNFAQYSSFALYGVKA